jgi:hypothetical protein
LTPPYAVLPTTYLRASIRIEITMVYRKGEEHSNFKGKMLRLFYQRRSAIVAGKRKGMRG